MTRRRRPGAGARLLASLGALAGACAGDAALQLPEPAPEAELAFAALYDGDQPARVGAVVRRQALYAGRYALRGPSGLEARLYFLRTDDLVAAGRAACEGRERAADRLSCEEAIAACADAPEGCWLAAPTAEGCGDRLALGADVPVATYVADAGELEAGADMAAAGLVLCGPAVELACPNRRPGYLVGRGGAFACVADVRQTGCEVTIDLSGCGLPDVRGALEADGGLVGADGGACDVAPASSPPLLGVEGELAVTCAGTTYALYPQDGLLAAPGCPRRGPGIFETTVTRTGRITSAAVLPSRSVPRLYLHGYGADECAGEGCAIGNELMGSAGREGLCNDRCDESCLGLFTIPACARDGWASCAPVGEQEACNDRCRAYCNRPDGAPCGGDAFGLALSVVAPDAPERDVLRLGLDARGGTPADGHPTVALPGGPWLVTVSGGEVAAFEVTGADVVEPRGFAPLALEGAGVLAYAEDAVAAFGKAEGEVRVQAFDFTRGADPFTAAGPPIALPGLPGADVGAAGGPAGDWIFVAATAPRLGRPPPNRVGVAAIFDGAALPEVALPGPASALLALPGGAVLAGYDGPDGGAGGLAVLEPGTGRVAEVHTQPLPPGLSLSAAALDAETCDRPAPRACRVWLGFERTQETGPALLGAALYDATAPGPLAWQGRLARTAGQSLSAFVVDEEDGTIWAIAGARNLLTPLSLWR